ANELAVRYIEVAELLIIADSRIFQDESFELPDSFSPWKSVERMTKQTQIRDHFHEDVNCGPERAQKDNDPKPVHVRSASDEMDERNRLQNQAPWRKQKSHVVVPGNIPCGAGVGVKVGDTGSGVFGRA